MAKTYKNLWPDIIDFGSLLHAWSRTEKGRRRQHDVLAFKANLEPNLINIQNHLIYKTYETGPYKDFQIYEPKQRTVSALPLKDRVVQHSLVGVIEPIFESRFIAQSYACRPGKGAHQGADKVQTYMREVKREHGQVYALKADIAKYFPSVCHDVLRRLLRRRIACPDTLWLLDQIISSTDDEGSLLPRGIPIGNLTSQLFANIYLHELDMFAKNDLREARYVRYMDDFVVIHHDKDHLHSVRADIEHFLWSELGLRTNSKTQVFPIEKKGGRGLDFLGYRIWPTHRALRKDSIQRMRKKMKYMAKLYGLGQMEAPAIQAVVRSWVGHAKHADTYDLRRNVLGNPFIRREVQ